MSGTIHIRALPHSILALLAIVLASCSGDEQIISQQMRAHAGEQERQRVATVQRQNQQLFTTHVHEGLEGCLREFFSISKNYSDLAVCRNTVEAKALTQYNAQGYAFLFRQRAALRMRLSGAVTAGKITTQQALDHEEMVLAQMEANSGSYLDPDNMGNVLMIQMLSGSLTGHRGMSYPAAQQYLQQKLERQMQIQ